MGLLLMACGVGLFAQGSSNKRGVSGVVVDAVDKTPVMQATVQLLNVKDSVMVTGAITDLDGRFSVQAKTGNYIVKISFVGYKSYFKNIALTRKNPSLNMGTVALESDAVMLQGVTITGKAAEMTAVDDTLVYNSAAYRVPEGSALEELVKKLPGAEVDEEGKITINGKEVKKIMVDGKEFFADDPDVAMKNLPVNIIDKIKSYEKQSDMARMTGIDDGEEETVIDLSIKPGMNKGWIGNADLAAGTKDRYSGRIMANYFKDHQQFTVMGSMNNVNDQGFPGGGGGRWWGNNGLTAVKSGGFNFATETEKLETGGSVNFNYRDADMISKQSSETFVSTANSSFGNSVNANNNKNTNVRADFRIEWKPDTLTNLMFRPRITYGKSESTSGSNSFTFNQDPGHSTDELLAAQGNNTLTDLVPEANIVNTIVRNSLSKSDDVNAGGSLLFNRRLGKPGRNVTFRGSFNYTNSSSESFSTSNTQYFQVEDLENGTLEEIINRYRTTPSLAYDYSLRFSYSEPILDDLFLQLSYNFQYRRTDSDNDSYRMPDNWLIDYGYGGNWWGTPEPENSTEAVYDYFNHQAELSLRWNRENFQLNAGVAFLPQYTKLHYEKGEYKTDTTRNVFNVTPTFRFRYKFSKTAQLEVRYRGRTSQPGMTDLLPITDDSDPLNIREGNPGLRPAFTNSFEFNYRGFNPETQRGLFSFFNFSNTMNQVSSRRTYNPETGGYTTKPENINGNWNLFGMLGSNTALKNKEFTISTNTNVNYQNMVSYISDRSVQEAGNDKNTTKRLGLGERLRGTYRNDWFEFSLNGSINYTHLRNSYQTNNNQDTYQYSYGASTNINLPWNMTLSSDISQNSRRGYSDASMNRDELIWNAQIAQSFLKGNAATISLQFYDILRRQSNISRSISAAMRQDIEYNAIYSYAMIHFVYKLNLFGGKQGGGAPGRGPGGGPGGGPRPARMF